MGGDVVRSPSCSTSSAAWASVMGQGGFPICPVQSGSQRDADFVMSASDSKRNYDGLHGVRRYRSAVRERACRDEKD